MNQVEYIKQILKSLNIPFTDPCDPNYTGDCGDCGGGGGVVTSVTLSFNDTTNVLTATVDGITDTDVIPIPDNCFQCGSGAPTGGTPVTPVMYVDTATGELYRYNGAAWVVVTPTTTLTNGNIFVGGGANVPQDVTMSGDATIAVGGALTVISATTTQAGKTRLATTVEADGTSSSIAVTPAGVEAVALKKKLIDNKGDVIFGEADDTATILPASTNDGSSLFEDSTTISGWNIMRNTYTGTVAPTVNEDSGDGFREGSVWVDIVAGNTYMCVDRTGGAAVWVQTNGAGGGTYTASAVNALLGIDVTGLAIGLDINGLADLGVPSDDDALVIYRDGTSTNQKVLAQEFLPRNRVFASDTNISPAVSGAPTAAEIKTWNDGLGTPHKDTIIYYNGTDVSTNLETYVFHADRASIITGFPGAGGTNDGYHVDVVRGNATKNVAPTIGEHPSAIDGSSAQILLSDGAIEHWNFNVAWALQFTQTPTGGYRYTSVQSEIWATGLGVTTAINATTGVWTIDVPAGVVPLRVAIDFNVGDTSPTPDFDAFIRMDYSGLRSFNTGVTDFIVPTGGIMANGTAPTTGGGESDFYYFNNEGLSGNSIKLQIGTIGGGDGSDIDYKLVAPAIAADNTLLLTFGEH